MGEQHPPGSLRVAERDQIDRQEQSWAQGGRGGVLVQEKEVGLAEATQKQPLTWHALPSLLFHLRHRDKESHHFVLMNTSLQMENKSIFQLLIF